MMKFVILVILYNVLTMNVILYTFRVPACTTAGIGFRNWTLYMWLKTRKGFPTNLSC